MKYTERKKPGIPGFFPAARNIAIEKLLFRSFRRPVRPVEFGRIYEFCQPKRGEISKFLLRMLSNIEKLLI